MMCPPRIAFGDEEYDKLVECLKYYRSNNIDPPYDGLYQKSYESLFASEMNGGFATAVNSGSSATYIAIKSLELPNASKVLMSPVTDTSSLHSILLCGHKPIILDTRSDSYNTSLENVQSAYTRDTKAIYLVHTYGVMADVVRIRRFCSEKGIYLIEDFSQAPFASIEVENLKVYAGEFGDISCCSTMYRKTLNTSSSGGIVFTKNKILHKNIIEFSDRGRKKWNLSNNARDGGNVNKLSHNFNTSEFSCAVGIASLKRCKTVVEKRMFLANYLLERLKNYEKYIVAMELPKGSSPFLIPIIFTEKGDLYRDKLYKHMDKMKIPFARSYPCFAYDWNFTKAIYNENIIDLITQRYQRQVHCKMATRLKKLTFNIYLHEGYTIEYLDYMLKSFAISLSDN